MSSLAAGAGRLLRAALAGARILEIDAERDTALTGEFGVFHLPALFLFHNGHFQAGLKAQARPGKLQQAIDAALLAPAEELP